MGKFLPWLLGGIGALATGGLLLGAMAPAAAGAAGAAAAGAGAAGAAGATGAGLGALGAGTGALGAGAGTAATLGATTVAPTAAMTAAQLAPATAAATTAGTAAAGTAAGAGTGLLGGLKTAGSALGSVLTPGNIIGGTLLAQGIGGLMGGGEGGGMEEDDGPTLDRDQPAREVNMPSEVDFTKDVDTSEWDYFPQYAEGGPVGATPLQGDTPDAAAQQEIVKGAVAAIEGKHPQPEEAIELFIEFFGADAFEDLMADVDSRKAADAELAQVTGGGAPTEGGIGAIKGEGDGMSDSIPAVIDGKTPARIATDEHIIPADVVSGLGNGSSDAGHRVLSDMTANVRGARTGTTEQPPAIDPRRVVPA